MHAPLASSPGTYDVNAIQSWVDSCFFPTTSTKADSKAYAKPNCQLRIVTASAKASFASIGIHLTSMIRAMAMAIVRSRRRCCTGFVAVAISS